MIYYIMQYKYIYNLNMNKTDNEFQEQQQHEQHQQQEQHEQHQQQHQTQQYQQYEHSTQDIETTQQNPKKPQQKITLQIDKNRPKYGRMKVLLSKGPILITIGPDYLCFIGGFTFFCILAYILCATVSSVFENKTIIITSYSLSILQCGSYLLVALSNPNIALAQHNPIKPSQITTQNQNRICKKCGAQLRRKTYHCRQCDVCVIGYDHHCPWTSKCIGSGNLYRFYLFVTVTPIYILLFMAIMMACLVTMAGQVNQNLKTNL